MKNDKKTDGEITRRDFLTATAATTAAFTIVPRHVLGGNGQTPPSEKLNIASVGAGGMAANNINACSGENIVALCDVDDNSAADTYLKYPNANIYRDFRVMLEKEEKNIDAVIIATPDHTHAVAAMAAMQLGKHVYVQKPLTHSIYEARKLREAAREYKVATQMGNQGHSAEGARLTNEWIQDGAIGPVREVHSWTDRPLRGSRLSGTLFWPQGVGRPAEIPPVPATLDWDLWLGPAPYRPYHPKYAPFNWRGWWDFGTGSIGDMACHIVDHPFWALKLGHPISVQASSTMMNCETYPEASITTFEFPARGEMPPVKLTWYDGGLKPPRPFDLEAGRDLPSNGTLFVGDKGNLLVGEKGGSPRIIPETKMKEYKLPAKTMPRVDGSHEQNWIDACKGGPAACSNFEYSGLLTEVVLLGNIALRYEEKLEWDGENMKVTNIPEANQYVRREYRDGWSL